MHILIHVMAFAGENHSALGLLAASTLYRLGELKLSYFFLMKILAISQLCLVDLFGSEETFQ